jgi:4,4'-diaponeurosporenoate glycosyltransferase
LIPRELYYSAGGHAAVREHVLENLYLAPKIRACGGSTQAMLGAGSLQMRLFPDGFASLCRSWMKGFASGAKATPQRTMLLSVVWLFAGVTPLVTFLFAHGLDRWTIGAMYLLVAVQTFLLARALGTYRWYTAAAYPVALLFYLLLFGASSLRGRTGREVMWKGRPV